MPPLLALSHRRPAGSVEGVGRFKERLRLADVPPGDFLISGCRCPSTKKAMPGADAAASAPAAAVDLLLAFWLPGWLLRRSSEEFRPAITPAAPQPSAPPRAPQSPGRARWRAVPA